jgi:cobalt-zinc-cadmium resistance protein CzcA
MMSSLFISRNAKGSKDFSEATMERIGTTYQWALQRVLNHPKITLGFTTAFFILSIFLFSRMGAEFIPELEEGDFAVDTRVLTGSNLNTTIAATQKSAGILLNNFPEVEKVVSKIGSGEIPTDPMPIEAADMMVILKDKSTWTSAKSYDELAEKMSEKLAAVPGVTFGFQFPVQMRFNELMTGAKQDVVVKIFGDHLDTLKNYAERVSEVLHNMQGVQDIYVEPIAGMPQIVVQFKREMLTQYGVNIEDANRVIKGLYAGDEVGRLYEAEQFFPIVLRIDADLRKNMDQLGLLQIRNVEGRDIPLSLIADIRTIEGPNQIQREDARRRIIVGFNLRDADVKTVVSNLKQALEKEVQLPAGYYFVYGGSFENLEAAQKRLQIALPFALLLILVLLYFAFGSISLGLLIFTAIPLSAIGGIMALYVRDMPFSISAGVGFIALFGVAVLNGIVLISEFNRIQNAGLHDVQEIVKQGTKQRLRPVLMTAVVASLGFLPMALSNGAGAEVQRPLATVVMGGLLTATVLTLFLLPLAYTWYEGRKKMKKTKTVLMIFTLFALSSQSQAQSWTNLKQDILNNNQEIKANNTYQQAYAESKGGAWQFGNTEIAVQSGQYNSDAKDLAFSLSQGFRFPTYYAHANSLVKNGRDMIANEANIKRLQILSEAYFQYQFLIITGNRDNYYQQLNETFARLIPIINLQYEKGMLSIIEKANLLMLQQKISEQQMLNSLESERSMTYLSFIAGNKTSIQTDSNSFYRKEMLVVKTGSNSAALQQRWLATQAQEQRWKSERSRALPEFKIGYTNQSLNGIPWEGGLSTSSDRFSFISVGLSFPLLNASQYNTIGLQRASYEFEKANFNWESQREQIQKNQMQKQIAMQQKILEQYEKEILPSMHAALKASQLLLQQGQISAMEWLQFINQCEDTYQNYYRAQLNCLQSFTELKLLEQSF